LQGQIGKIKHFNNVLKTAKNDRTQERTKNLFRTIKQFMQFNPIWNEIKDHDGQMLMEPESRVKRWKEYFEEFFNGMVSDEPLTQTEYERAEPHVSNVTLEEIKTSILSLKN